MIVSQPTCVACMPGYTLDSTGNCSKDSVLSTLTNCFMTLPNDVTKCMICIPGSYMTSPGVCNTASYSFTSSVLAGV